MTDELTRIFGTIEHENLTEENKRDLLEIFKITRNHGLRGTIALLFADLEYHDAVPAIIEKINDKDLFNRNGTLVYVLNSLEAGEYFLNFIKIVAEHDYEARLGAYQLVEKYAPTVSEPILAKAIAKLEQAQHKEEQNYPEKYDNSKLHFIDATLRLLQPASNE